MLFADQSDWDGKRGFYVAIENSAAGNTACTLSTLRVTMGVADGSQWRFIVHTPPAWQLNRDYTVKATITPSGFDMYLDDRLVERVSGGFSAFTGSALNASQVPGWASGQSDYFATQSSLNAASSSGTQVNLDGLGASTRPLPLQLLAPGNMPQAAPFNFPEGDTLTITARFRLTPQADFRQYAPYFDRYGQSIHATFPGKITSDADLTTAAAEEETRLAAWGDPPGYDRYGGVAGAGWRSDATGYYRVLERNGIWWLISPDGNPCFYTGLDTAPAVDWDRTPVTGRTNLFEWFPPKTAPYTRLWGRDSWWQGDGTEDVGYAGVNLVRKYGEGWETKAVESTVRRMRVWGFTGFGKWNSGEGKAPVLPVLSRGDVPSVDRHPDIFDTAIQQRFRNALEWQIKDRRTDPLVVGWSLGNEFDEIITAEETRNILAKGSGVAAKRALVDEAMRSLYGGDVARLAKAWGINAVKLEDIYASRPSASAGDVEALRKYYARAYYGWVYQAIKELDPNHLYFGGWIVPGWWENESDWDLIAEFVDVIGYDRYADRFSDDTLDGYIRRTGKPVLCGEFGFPAHYNLMRGYHQYPVASTVDDAESGDAYMRWIADAARHPYAVGVGWFQYRDEPVSGRGPGQGPELVYGENFAFGMVDVGDRPKWDLVTRVREANLGAVKRRLSFQAPALNEGGAVNSASFAPGAAVAPGSIISIFGTDLAGDHDAASSLPLPSKLGGANLQLGGIAVPLIHAVPPYQIDAVVPWELEGQTTAMLDIVTSGLAGNRIPVKLATYAPGIFTGNSSGHGQGAVLINGTRLLASPISSLQYQGRPAKRGEWLNIYCTGLGPVNNRPQTGTAAAAGTLTTTVVPASVKIGGVDAPVNFSGLAAGFVGLYQVNAQVPDGIAPGDAIPLLIEIGGVASNTVTIAIE